MSLQSDFKARRSKILKRPAHYHSFINDFNIKLWGGITTIEGFNETDDNELPIVSIDILLERALLDI